MKQIGAVGFLILFLPYTVTLLASGRQGIRKEQKLPDREYQVIGKMLEEDLSWMDDETLRLMAVIKRTETVREGNDPSGQQAGLEEFSGLYGSLYQRICRAVEETQGQVIQIGGELKELPYHEMSAGSTREGGLLGEEYRYCKKTDCPEDREAEGYTKFYLLDPTVFWNSLSIPEQSGLPVTECDESGYVTELLVGEIQIPGEKVRELLHLDSSCFTLSEQEGKIRIAVKGSGHGFGISLHTAAQMMKKGDDLTAVIKKFYEAAECITLP